MEKQSNVPRTNGDYIRSLDNEQLKRFIQSCQLDPCGTCCIRPESCLNPDAPKPDCYFGMTSWVDKERNPDD